jgi:hypothetical protein
MDIVSNCEMHKTYLIDQTNYVTQNLCMYRKGLVTFTMYNRIVDLRNMSLQIEF